MVLVIARSSYGIYCISVLAKSLSVAKGCLHLSSAMLHLQLYY